MVHALGVGESPKLAVLRSIRRCTAWEKCYGSMIGLGPFGRGSTPRSCTAYRGGVMVARWVLAPEIEVQVLATVQYQGSITVVHAAVNRACEGPNPSPGASRSFPKSS